MPITRTVATEVSGTPDALFAQLVDLKSWPEWDSEIIAIEALEAKTVAGTTFRLKPRGGPWVSLKVEAIEPPTLFRDVSKLPLARMRTSHRFAQADTGRTRVEVEIVVSGPLAWLWDRVVARKQIAGTAAQTAEMAQFARAQES